MLGKSSTSCINRSVSMFLIHRSIFDSAPTGCKDLCIEPDHALEVSPRFFTAPVAYFLDACYLCKKRLRRGHDIYMYRGDTAFCSDECRQQQISHDQRAEKLPMKISNCHDDTAEAKYSTQFGLVTAS